VLKQQRLFFVAAFEYPSDRDRDVATILAAVDLRRAAPTAIQQDACRRHARGCWRGLLADDPGKHPDALLGVSTRHRAQIGWNFLSGQWLAGGVYPLLSAASGAATIIGNNIPQRRAPACGGQAADQRCRNGTLGGRRKLYVRSTNRYVTTAWPAS